MLEDNLFTTYSNICHCINSLHIFHNSMATTGFLIWKKNMQSGSTFKSLDFRSENEKIHFNRQLRTLLSQMIRAKSHLHFYEKYLKHGVYPDNLNVRDHFQVAFNTPKFKKAYSDLNKNT